MALTADVALPFAQGLVNAAQEAFGESFASRFAHLDQFTGSQAGTRLRSMPQSTCPTNTSNRTTCMSKPTQDLSLLRSLTRGNPPCSKLAISIGSILELLRKKLVRISKRLDCSKLI